MEGRLIYLNRDKGCGKVDTRNDDLGVLTICFSRVPDRLQEDCTVEFQVKTSREGRTYAKFVAMVDRNRVQFHTEDRSRWYQWGEGEEQDFLKQMVPRLGIDLRLNPEKKTVPWAIDLFDYTNNRPADLKAQNTPFFTAGKYLYHGKPYDPSYTVTFNRKDYEHYKQYYPSCDIYFWVHWLQREYRNLKVDEVHGVWRASFAVMANKIQTGDVALHAYKHRTTDDHNAKDSYLFYLLDTDVFERLL